MSTINDGGPVFPVTELNGQGEQELTHPGMTLRAYFAAHAPITYADAIEKLGKVAGKYEAVRWLVEAKVIYADAMIAEMERKA